MSFLSGLRKAYDTLEGEITKTFDSSQTTNNDSSTQPSDEGGGEEEEEEEVVREGKETKGERRNEENWGDWEEQTTNKERPVVKKTVKPTSEVAEKPLVVEEKKESTQSPGPSEMRETATPSPVASSTPAKTAGGKLDSLPRSELIKYVKKQAQLLQKTKTKCDELSKECIQLQKTSSGQTSDTERLVEEMQVVRGERDRAVAEQRTLQQTISSLQLEKQSESEVREKLERKVKQLESTEEDMKCRVQVAATQFSALEQDHKLKIEKLETELRHSKEMVAELVEAQRVREKEKEVERKEEDERKKRKEEEERERWDGLRKEMDDLKEKLTSSENEEERLRAELDTVREKEEEETKEMEKMKDEMICEKKIRTELEDELDQLRTELAKREEEEEERKEVEDSAGVILDLRQMISNLESELKTALSERETLQKEHGIMKTEREEMNLQMMAAEEKMGQKEKEMEEVEKELREKREKRDRIEELETECSELRTAVTKRDSEEEDREEEKEVGTRLQLEKEVMEKEVEVERAEKEKELDQLRSEVDRLQKEVEERKKMVEETEAKLCKEQAVFEQNLNQQIETHREETKKLKAYIVKMKKELTEAREKMATTTSSSSDEKAELQKQLYHLKETIQQSTAEHENKMKEAQETVKTLITELESEKMERGSLESSLAAANEELSVIRSELSTAQSDLATLHTQVGGARRATEEAEKKTGSLREELAREKENHSSTKQKLTAAVKEVKVSNVMNLELADYQRSLQSLEEKLASAQSEIAETKEEEKRQQEKMEGMRKEMDLKTQQGIGLEDRLSKTKSLWMKTKKELDTARKTEGELQMNISSLTAQLENEKQLAEQNKVEMVAMTTKLQSTQQESDSSVGVLQKTVRSLEHRLTAAQSDLTSSQLSLSQCQQDYNNYKIRVHSVLKQKNSGPSAAEISTELRQKYEGEIAQLKAELQDSKTQLTSALAELEEVTDEHQQLSSRHQLLVQDSQSQLTSITRQYEEAEFRHSRESKEQTEVIGQLRQEVVEVTETFRSQLQLLQEEHQKVVHSLSSELDNTKTTLAKLQQEADVRVLVRASSQTTSSIPSRTQTTTTVQDHRIVTDTSSVPPAPPVPIERRSSGEGMDQSELDSFPPTPLSREDSQMSFERLLSTTDHSDTPAIPPSSTFLTSSSNKMPQLRGELIKAKKTIRDLTELLRESEEAGIRLGEQAKLLKEEIRRLERNREREEGVSNMEYLKNVVLKFLHSEDGGEQTALIPVITQLLRLSPQETKFLHDTIKGTPVTLPDAGSALPSPSSHNKGLAGYIHRWTGY